MMLRSFRAASMIALVGLSTCGVRADESVLPGGYESTAGGLTFLGPLSNAQRTIQWLIHSDQLTALVGQDLTGMTFRASNGSTTSWPTAAVDITNYDIRLSEGVAPASRNLTSFAANVVGSQTLVRSGPLHIEADSFPVGVAPHPFGPTIAFDPWHYAGGHLLIELRSTGFSGTSRSVDAVGTTASTGYGTQFSAMWTGSYTAAAGGTQGNFVVIRLTSTPGGAGGCNLADITEVGGTTETPGTPDGQLTVDDIIVFVNLYSDATGCPGVAPCSLADVCGIGGPPEAADGQLTVDDIIAFFNAFSDGCAP